MAVTSAVLRWAPYAQAFGSAYNVPPALVLAIIAVESGGDPKAFRREQHVSDASRGLMQLLYSTAQSVGYVGDPDGLFDPSQNINFGTKLLAQLRRQLGSWEDAISAYNGGIRPHLGFGRVATRPVTVCLARDSAGRCREWRDVKVGEYANQRYVNAVLRAWSEIEGKGVVATATDAGSSQPSPSAPFSS
jgi:soluble lytic murein transglycosylase-like protein